MSKVNEVNQELSQFQLQVKELLDNAGDDVINCFFYSHVSSKGELYDSYDGASNFNAAVDSARITIEQQAKYGGEGQGEDYWSVYKFTNGTDTCYVKFDGWYHSYNGSEFTEWFFVSPVEKMVTFYE